MYLWMLQQITNEVAKQRYSIVLYVGIFTCIDKNVVLFVNCVHFDLFLYAQLL